jgi:uncharacterized membrane protein YkvA (DUF1232 family)
VKLRPRRDRRRRARKTALSLIAQLPHLLRLLARLMRDPRIALGDKVLFAGVAAYLLMPADLIPDLLAPLGLIDDVYLVGLALARLFGRAGPDVLLEHWDGDPRALGYLVEGVHQIGGLLPGPVRSTLRKVVRRAG